MNGFQLQRLGTVMEPEPGNPQEIEGVLNPAAVRGPDGELYLFPRLVARGQLFPHRHCAGPLQSGRRSMWSRTARHRTGAGGGLRAAFRRRRRLRGSAHHVRRTAPALYDGLRGAFARRSADCRGRIGGPVPLEAVGARDLRPFEGIDFVHVDNKDASLFPVAIPNHSGKMQMAMLHRPLFPGTRPEETACQAVSREVDLAHESIWISYCPMAIEGTEPQHLGLFNSHHRLATPVVALGAAQDRRAALRPS